MYIKPIIFNILFSKPRTRYKKDMTVTKRLLKKLLFKMDEMSLQFISSHLYAFGVLENTCPFGDLLS